MESSHCTSNHCLRCKWTSFCPFCLMLFVRAAIYFIWDFHFFVLLSIGYLCLEFFTGFLVFLGQRLAFSEKHCMILGPILLPSFSPVERSQWLDGCSRPYREILEQASSTSALLALEPGGRFFVLRRCVPSSMLTNLPRLCC